MRDRFDESARANAEFARGVAARRQAKVLLQAGQALVDEATGNAQATSLLRSLVAVRDASTVAVIPAELEAVFSQARDYLAAVDASEAA